MSTTLNECRLIAASVPLSYADSGTGAGAPFLLLHGGAGPASMAGLAWSFAGERRVLTPVHPGFDGTPRPEWFRTVGDLATAYLAFVESLDLDGVVIVGNSVGGWIAAEMALRRSPRVRGVVLVDAVGIDTGSAEKPIVDPMAVPPAERAALAFHDPVRFTAAPRTPEGQEAMAQNQRTLRVYAGTPFMHDPSLRERLAGIDVPALVAWG